MKDERVVRRSAHGHDLPADRFRDSVDLGVCNESVGVSPFCPGSWG
jgi:hypothetical protein